jgi:hypothetical protein
MNRCRALILGLAAAALTACGSTPTRPSPPAQSRSLVLTWAPVTTAEDGSPIEISGYQVSCGISPAALAAGPQTDAATTQATLTLPAGTYYCSAVAIASDGTRSDPSNTVAKTL